MHQHERSLKKADPDFGKQEASKLRGQLTKIEVLLGKLDGMDLKHVTPPLPPSDSPPGQPANRTINPQLTQGPLGRSGLVHARPVPAVLIGTVAGQFVSTV